MPIEIGNVRLYSLQEISAKINNVSPQTLRSYIQDGRLKGRKFGQKWYVSEQALQEYFLSPPKEELHEEGESEMEKGKRLVESYLENLSPHSVTDMKWGQSTEDFKNCNQRLAYRVSGKRETIAFLETDLEDVESTPGIQEKLKAKIEDKIKTPTSGNRENRK